MIDPADLAAGGLLDDPNRTLGGVGVVCWMRRNFMAGSGLQERLELAGVTTLHEKGVGIVALGQENTARDDALCPVTLG